MKQAFYRIILAFIAFSVIPLASWAEKAKITATDDEQTENQTFVYKEKLSNMWYHWNPDGTLSTNQVYDGWSALNFQLNSPRNGVTIKDEKWISKVSNSLMQNRVAIKGKSKYYFAPKGDIRITAQNGTTYKISPQGNANKATYDMLCTLSGEQFTWDEATLGEVLGSHSIVYGGEGAGVFNNDILYAYAYGKYTPIVRLTQEQDYDDSNSWSEAGTLELIKYLPVGSTVADFYAGTATENTVLYDVLNAIGFPNLSADGKDYSQCDYDYQYRNLNRQLRAWIGYVKNDGNNVAQYVEQGKYDDDNKATFLVSWTRPLNLYVSEPAPITADESHIYLIDYLRLYDWRGDKPRWGYMYDDRYWLWSYYNVKEIDVDLSPKKVLTNLGQQQADMRVPLSSVSTQIILNTIDGFANLGKYPFDLVSNREYLSYDYETVVEQYMGVNPIDDSRKAQFGGIYYKNLTGETLDFTVEVPVTVKYEFGSVSTMMKITFGKGHHTNSETAVSTISMEQPHEAYYNLQGQRVSNPTTGLYIKSGRKMAVK